MTQIRDVLLPYAESKQQPHAKAGYSETRSVNEHLANIFSLLQVEEPSTSPLGDKPQKKKKVNPAWSSTLEDDGFHMDFALWCHVKDMHDVRAFLKQSWLQYAAGALSIVLVSQLSEVGIGLMRLEDEKFVAKYPQFKDWWALLPYFGLEAYGSGRTTYVFGSL